ncbi:MAG: hypothetical protein QF449_08275 [Alphaproteobacteria bacterium]|jgi:hypothetical protein|nr:hypothetical protein [Alphaproteobacteria bacterium]MDP6818022.1 hypothetical protein [Alphaproteobacteria bacterium]|tara:strand:- start:1320 stop:1835 length:516 start_codon:yes stop_codon:yes gene_type:complete
MDNDMMLVPLRQETVARLFACRLNADEKLDGVLKRLAETDPETSETRPAKPTAAPPERGKPGRYRATLDGETIAANSLREILAGILNRLANTDGKFLSRLSASEGRTRRHVSQRREAIHPGRDDLNRRYTEEFRPGWWVGTNYSATDVRRILKDACRAADISFGRDLTIDF